MSQNHDPQAGDATSRVPRQPVSGASIPPQPPYGVPQQPPQPPYGAPWQPSSGDPSSYGQFPQPPQPTYGPPPGSGYGGPPGEKPKVRPRLLWIPIAWLIFVLSLVVGFTVFGGSLFSAVTDAAPTTSFKSGEIRTVTLDPKDKPVLYASASTAVKFTCAAADSADKEVALTKSPLSQTVTDGTRRWELVFQIGAKAPGQYKVRCDAPADSDVLFGVGRDLTAGAGKLVGGAVALFVVSLIGFLYALVTTIVILVRRSRNRAGATAPRPYAAPPAN